MFDFGLTTQQADSVIFCLFLIICLLVFTIVEMRIQHKGKIHNALKSTEEAIELAWATGARREDIHRIIDEIYCKDETLEKRTSVQREDSIF